LAGLALTRRIVDPWHETVTFPPLEENVAVDEPLFVGYPPDPSDGG
jgi:hypothetical protein